MIAVLLLLGIFTDAILSLPTIKLFKNQDKKKNEFYKIRTGNEVLEIIARQHPLINVKFQSGKTVRLTKTTTEMSKISTTREDGKLLLLSTQKKENTLVTIPTTTTGRTGVSTERMTSVTCTGGNCSHHPSSTPDAGSAKTTGMPNLTTTICCSTNTTMTTPIAAPSATDFNHLSNDIIQRVYVGTIKCPVCNTYLQINLESA